MSASFFSILLEREVASDTLTAEGGSLTAVLLIAHRIW